MLGDLFEAEIVRLGVERPKRWLERSFAILDLSVFEAAALTGRFEVLAREGVGSDEWTAEIYGSALAIVLGVDTELLSVLMGMPKPPDNVNRRYIARINESGPQLVAAERLRQRSG